VFSHVIGQEVAQYRILAKLGAGGMGVVYLAQDARLERRVALKVLPTEFALDEERIARFEREARAVAALSHPGIAVLYEIGEADGIHYLAMEFVEGRPLQDQLALGPLSRESLIDYIVQIADALEHAHCRGSLHRDIKAANILVRTDGRVKLLDFGLAKLLEGDDKTRSLVTAPGTWMGTLQYCAPETLRGQEADRRSDLYSLGIVLYQMACGRLPFEGLDGHALVSAILRGESRPIRRTNPLIDEAIERFIARAISVDPEERPQSAAEFSKTLRQNSGSTGAVPMAVTHTVPVLAVLDFQNISDDRGVDWLGTGLAETLTADLKRLKLVKVISRERVLEAARRRGLPDAGHSQLIELGKELGARWLVLGSYQRAGQRLRILPRVVEVATGEEAATAKIDGSWEDVFALQDRVVSDVLAEFEMKIDSSAMERIVPPETLQLEAYEQYAQGRQQFQHLGKESLERARQYFERAVALDPHYALAYAALGATHAMRYIHRTDPADLDHSARYSERAIELDPELGEPHPWLSYVYMRQGKVEQAVRTGHKGVEKQPDSVLSHYFLAAAYMSRSETDSALYQPAAKHFLDATLTDPRWGASWLCLGEIAVVCGEYDRAEQFLRTLRDIEHRPPGFGFFLGSEMILATVKQRRGDKEGAREMYAASTATLESHDHVYREAFLALTACGLGEMLLGEGRTEAALTEFRRAMRLVKEYPRMLGRQRVLTRTLAGMSAVHASLGEASHARQSLEEAAQHLTEISHSPQSWVWEAFLGQLYFSMAVAHHRLGESDVALDCLERAVRYGWRDPHWLASDPEFIALRRHRRFKTLQENLQLLPALEFQPSAGISASPIGKFAPSPV
jgi:TolB-like protein/predicted Ser/Thr protein kinase/Flp pilus assembly protein TadD